MSDYVAQVTDQVVLTLTLPNYTEEWADETLAEPSLNFDSVERDSEGQLVVKQIIGGNCNAVANAAGFLAEIEDALRDCLVDPMTFTLHAEAVQA